MVGRGEGGHLTRLRSREPIHPCGYALCTIQLWPIVKNMYHSDRYYKKRLKCDTKIKRILYFRSK